MPIADANGINKFDNTSSDYNNFIRKHISMADLIHRSESNEAHIHMLTVYHTTVATFSIHINALI